MGLFSGYECDKCGAVVTYYGNFGSNKNLNISRKMLTLRARAAGWKIGDNVICPRCKTKK